ncbi:hypothetical protein IWX50DRAFT_492196 [Phyllosticta citricarpa]
MSHKPLPKRRMPRPLQPIRPPLPQPPIRHLIHIIQINKRLGAAIEDADGDFARRAERPSSSSSPSSRSPPFSSSPPFPSRSCEPALSWLCVLVSVSGFILGILLWFGRIVQKPLRNFRLPAPRPAPAIMTPLIHRTLVLFPLRRSAACAFRPLLPSAALRARPDFTRARRRLHRHLPLAVAGGPACEAPRAPPLRGWVACSWRRDWARWLRRRGRGGRGGACGGMSGGRSACGGGGMRGCRSCRGCGGGLGGRGCWCWASWA